MSDSKEKSAPSDQVVKQLPPGECDVSKTAKSSEPLVKKAIIEKEPEQTTASNIELPEKTTPAAGREASYVYDVLNMPSTVDTTGLRPDPGFELKLQSTFGQDLQEQSKSTDELMMRKDSSNMYKEELVKIELMVKSKGAPPTKPDYGQEFRLTEDPAKAKLFHSPWQWIAPVSSEILQQNIRAIVDRKDAAVRVADETVLAGRDFTFCRERRLFANKRNAFFLGKYKKQLVLVKKINASAAENSISDPIWVAISKRISYSQQVNRETSAVSSGTSDGTVLTADDSKKFDTCSISRPTCPFLQVYEIFRLESDRSWMVFLEMAANKTLHYRVKHRTSTDVSQVRLWSAQVLDGITFLANHGVTHRAIRLEHIVLDSGQNARIIGWRRAMALSDIVTRRERRVRSNNHLPPEAFNGGYQTGSVDLWSWGVVLCALTTYRYPFNVCHQRGTVEDEWSFFKARHPASGHPQVTAILDTLFLTEPEKRATVAHIQQSVWFGGAGQPVHQSVPKKDKPSSEKTTSGKSIKSMMGL